MKEKIFFGIIVFLLVVFTIGFILYMIGGIVYSDTLMDFGINTLLIAYTIIISLGLVYFIYEFIKDFHHL